MTSLRVCGGCKVELESLDSLFRESRLFFACNGDVGRAGERENGRTGERENGRTGERENGRTGEREGRTEERKEERKGVETS